MNKRNNKLLMYDIIVFLMFTDSFKNNIKSDCNSMQHGDGKISSLTSKCKKIVKMPIDLLCAT